jgi:uncharacterized SAM-binding protein YcdF (DUF218 family)
LHLPAVPPDATIVIAFLKLAGSVLYPLNLALSALVVSVLVGRRRPVLARRIAVIAIAWLWLWSLPIIAERAAWTLEHDFPPVEAMQLPDTDAIVLLGGFLDAAQPPFAPDPDLNSAADRAWFATRLWRMGKAPLLVCTSGRAPLSRSIAPECPGAVQLLRDFGVPDHAVVVEGASRTTRENATGTARMLPPGARILLVTSARHMPRSVAAFEHAGLTVVPAPTDHVFRPGRPFSITALLPSPGALAMSTSVWHEWLGRAWYSLGQ